MLQTTNVWHRLDKIAWISIYKLIPFRDVFCLIIALGSDAQPVVPTWKFWCWCGNVTGQSYTYMYNCSWWPGDALSVISPVMWNIKTHLTHCGLVTPYGDRDLGQLWLRQWLVAWRHQAITWTNVDWSSVKSSDIHIRAISQEMPQPPITNICLKITYLKFHSNFPGPMS